MKIIGLEIKKIIVNQFYPKEDKIELKIDFNDGSDKEFYKKVSISGADMSGNEVVSSLIKLMKKIHDDPVEGETLADSYVNVAIKEEENWIESISDFVEKAGIKVNEISNKKESDGYLDLIRNLKGMKLESSDI